ncbi:MAG: hypothetical protein NTU44_15090, partial [Bacteroidetes bacterium]|nr:hypothetical protein [Bacteroidota bacterium]
TPYTYQWQSSTDNSNFSDIANATSASYQPGLLSQTTYYRQNQTSASGCGTLTTNTVTITVNSRPTGVISGTTTICSGQSAILNLQFTGTGPWSGTLSDGSPFNSSTASMQITKWPVVSTTYTISSLSDANCNSRSGDRTGSAIISVLPRPTGSLSGSTSTCQGQSLMLSIAVTGVGPWSGSLSDGTPFSGSSNPVFVAVSPAVTTVYTISSLVDSRCTSIGSDLSGTATVTIKPRPTSYITGDTTICNGQSTLLKIYVTGTGPWYGVLSNGNPFYGASSPILRSVHPGSTFIYTVVSLSDGNQCVGIGPDLTGMAMVGVIPRPTGAISGTTSICRGESSDLTLHFTGTGPWIGTLSDGSAFSSTTATKVITKSPVVTTTYTISSLMDVHCTSLAIDLTGTAVVTVHPRPTGVISGTTTICNAQTAELTLTLTGTGPWGGTLSDGTVFSGNSNTVTINVSPSITTVYTISTLSDSYCNATPNDLGTSATITVNLRPTGVISGPASICAGQSAVLSIAVTGTGPWTGTLSDGSTFSGSASPIVVSRSPVLTTIYTITTLNDANCGALPAELSGSVNVIIHNRPTGFISGTTSICSGQTAIIEVSVTGTGPWNGTVMDGTSFSGNSSPILINVIPTATTTFTIGSLNDANCNALAADLSGTAKVTIKPRPTGVISGNATICVGQSANLSLTFTGKSPWSGLLSDGSSFTSTGNTLILTKSPFISTTYTITSLIDGNCTAWGSDLTGSATITVITTDTVTFTGLPAAICLYEGSVILTGGLPAGGVYSGPGVSGGSFNPLGAGAGIQTLTYTYASGGCVGSATATIQVINSMKSEVTVGAGGDYTTLTGATGVFNAINTHTLCGNLVVKVISSITEPGTVALNQWLEFGAGGYTVSIVTNDGTEKVLSGTYAGALIRLDRADRVIIDGRFNGQGMFLRLRNQHATNPTISLINDACNNTIRNCIIEGGNTTSSSGVILLGTTTLSTGNNNNLITSNLIRNRSDAAGIPANLVYSSGTVGKQNSSNILTYNEFRNFTSTGVTVAANGNGDSWTLIGNSFNMDLQTPVNTAQTAINFVPGANSLSNMIGLNRIGGSAANCTGSAWVNSGSVTVKGIVVNSNGTSVQGNEVRNISMTSTASPQFYGIDVTGGPFNIGNEIGNMIGDAVTSASINLGGRGSLYGIRTLTTTGNNLIANNLVANMVISGGSTTSAANLYGIVFTCATVSKNQVHSLGTSLSAIPLNIIGIQNNGTGTITNQVSDNMVSLNGLTGQSALIYGIQDMAATTAVSMYFYNTVSIFGSSNISKNSYCFYRKNAVSATLMNNLLSNTRSSGTSAQYTIYSLAGIPWSSNYNDLYTSTTPLGYYNAVNYNNIASWRTGTSGDAQSINIAPVFDSPVNLHLTPANYLIDGKGTPLVLVTDDIDGQPRGVQPDIGADEFTAVYPRIDNEKPVLVTDLNIYPNPFSGMTNISYRESGCH